MENLHTWPHDDIVSLYGFVSVAFNALGIEIFAKVVKWASVLPNSYVLKQIEHDWLYRS
jgi:hypothetical protein